MKKIFFLLLIIFISIRTNGQELTTKDMALGADVSWLTEMEASGKKFYNNAGQSMDAIELLKSLGMNTIRLRVWVNPTDNWCNKTDLLNKAIRANNLGMRLLIDFHYSDSWADPGKQTKPAAWKSLSFNDLKLAVATHTTEVLQLLKDNNIYPEWVQVGNETGNGMLWEDGRASTNMAQYAQLHNAGYDAVKSIFPDTKVMVHVHNGYDNSLFTWLIGGLVKNQARFDVIGMSLYPGWSGFTWQVANQKCLSNMQDMISKYNKDVMVVETGMSWDNAATCKLFLKDLIAKMKSIPNSRGLGVLYWEPQSYGQWKGYTLGAFDNTGKPTVALDAFQINTDNQNIPDKAIKITTNSLTREIIFSENIQSASVFNTSGQLEHRETGSVKFIHTSYLKSGIYLIHMTDFENNHHIQKIHIF